MIISSKLKVDLLIEGVEYEEQMAIDPVGPAAPHFGKRHFGEVEKLRIIELAAAGNSYRRIGVIIGRHHKNVSRFHRRWLETQRLRPEENRGRPRKTTDRDDRAILIKVKRNRFITAKGILSELELPGVSESTIRRRISESGEFNSYWAVKKPFINARNRLRRLQWCREHLHWTPEQWRRVMWTDESPFVLSFSGRIRIWRMHNERYSIRCLRGTVKHDIKINVWGAFCGSGVGRLEWIKDTLTKEKYLDILEEPMLHSADLLFGRENWLLQQDNDPKHTAYVVRDWLLENEIPTLDWWPAQSPDLNPIENLWSILDHRLKNRHVNTAEQLFAALQEAWNDLPVDMLQRLVDSMPARCQAVIDSRGYPTKY